MQNATRIKLFGTTLATILLASTALAQPEGRQRGFGEGRSPMGPPGPMRLLRELDLNETQRQQIRSIMEEVEATGAPARLRESRRALHEAIEAGADEATLRQAASQLGEAEGDAAVEWVRARARIQEILTDEQKKELEELEREAEERMDLDRRHREEPKARKSKSGANLL